MTREHPARITWSSNQELLGLPLFLEQIDPAWFADSSPGADEGWSLFCRFPTAPQEQGNPSSAIVRFMMPDAPHDRLRPGTRLQLFERATRQYALVEILD